MFRLFVYCVNAIQHLLDIPGLDGYGSLFREGKMRCNTDFYNSRKQAGLSLKLGIDQKDSHFNCLFNIYERGYFECLRKEGQMFFGKESKYFVSMLMSKLKEIV